MNFKNVIFLPIYAFFNKNKIRFFNYIVFVSKVKIEDKKIKTIKE